MYTPHYAAALAIKSKVQKAPVWALLIGAFLPDLVWIALARAGVESAGLTNFYDDWSHSLVSTIVLATIFGLAFWRQGKAAVVGIWLAVFSHFVLDFPVHPKRLALYPRSGIYLGWDSWIAWGSRPGWFGVINDWYLQLFTLLVFLTVYVAGMRGRMRVNLVVAACVVLVGLQLLMLSPSVGY